jgi:hypothetical protein
MVKAPKILNLVIWPSNSGWFKRNLTLSNYKSAYLFKIEARNRGAK